jgi:hypothetical protein
VLIPIVVSPRLKTAGLVKQRTFLGRSRSAREKDSCGHTACAEMISRTWGIKIICVSVSVRRRDEICCLKRDSIVGGTPGGS